jgi:hypothetical protein
MAPFIMFATITFLSLCLLRPDKFNLGWDCKVGELTFGGLYMVMFSLLEDKCHFMAKL